MPIVVRAISSMDAPQANLLSTGHRVPHDGIEEEKVDPPSRFLHAIGALMSLDAEHLPVPVQHHAP